MTRVLCGVCQNLTEKYTMATGVSTCLDCYDSTYPEFNDVWWRLWLGWFRGGTMKEPWWYFCRVCKKRLSLSDAMSLCDVCLLSLNDREKA